MFLLSFFYDDYTAARRRTTAQTLYSPFLNGGTPRRFSNAVPVIRSGCKAVQKQARQGVRGFRAGSFSMCNAARRQAHFSPIAFNPSQIGGTPRRFSNAVPVIRSGYKAIQKQARQGVRGFRAGSLLCVNDQAKTQEQHSIAPFFKRRSRKKRRFFLARASRT